MGDVGGSMHHSGAPARPGHLDRALARVAARQHGVVSRQQVEALGLGRGALARRIESGRLHRLHRGVYAFGHAALRVEGRWLAAVLAGGPGAVLSHRDAAALWELRSDGRALIDVTTPARTRERIAGVTLHRTRRLAPEEVTVLRGVPVTTVSRTLLDLAEAVPKRQVERAFDQADVLGLLDAAEIAVTLARNPGRRGLVALDELLRAHDRHPTLTRSELEERFLALVRQAALPEPEINVPLGRYIADFLWREPRLVVETDGRAYHTTRAAIERDRRRDADLLVAGYRTFRVMNRQVVASPAWVIDRLSRLLGERPRVGRRPRSARRPR